MVNVVDVLVIGTGTAGYTIALALNKAGRKVAVVDIRDCESALNYNPYRRLSLTHPIP